MSVADDGRQRDRTAQHRIRLLVILDERITFRRHGNHAVGGLSIRAAAPLRSGVASSRSSCGPEHVEEVGDRLVHDAALARQHRGAALVAREDQQNRIVFPFERTGEPSRSRP